MKKSLFAVFLAILSVGFTIGEAEAKRVGGGKSSGMQREGVTQRQATPPAAAPTPGQNAAAPAGATAAGAAAAAPKRNWMGPIAGLAAGLGIAALLSHFGMGEGMANFLMIALLVVAAVVVFKLLFRKKQDASSSPATRPMQFAGAGAPADLASTASDRPVAPASFGGGAAPLAAAAVASAAPSVPAGFDVDGFLRVAKLNFIRMQASNDAKNLDDLREFVSPEMFAEIKLDMDDRGNAPQSTEVVTLNAELLEVVTEGNRHIASVRFNGLVREEAGAEAVSFDEVWNLSKPAEGGKGWVVAGIQQVA